MKRINQQNKYSLLFKSVVIFVKVNSGNLTAAGTLIPKTLNVAVTTG